MTFDEWKIIIFFRRILWSLWPIEELCWRRYLSCFWRSPTRPEGSLDEAWCTQDEVIYSNCPSFTSMTSTPGNMQSPWKLELLEIIQGHDRIKQLRTSRSDQWGSENRFFFNSEVSFSDQLMRRRLI